MSSVSGAATGPQQYFQNQTVTKPDATKADAVTSENRKTQQVAEATSAAAATKPDATKADAAKSENLKTQQVAAGRSGRKAFESAATRNPDGTFGPRHTFIAPSLPLKPLTQNSSHAVSGVDIKV